MQGFEMKGVLESVIAKETADFESSAAGGGRSNAAAAEQGGNST